MTFTTICDHGERENACPSCRPSDPALGDLLEATEATLRRYVVMSDDAFAICSMWVTHVFNFAAAEFTPYLAVTSATMRSGKSRLLEVLEVILGPTRSVSTSNISPSSLFRLVDANPGVAVLVDEVDRISKDKADELWGLINSGWRFGGKAHRQGGPKMTELQTFSTFSPKVLAGIGQPLPGTVADRAIPIRMERKLPSEQVERLRLRYANAETAEIREGYTEWATENTLERLRSAKPKFPSGMTNDRLMDVSEPLLALADLAGGDWPTRVRAALLGLEDAGEQVAEEESSLLALRHIYETFISDGVEAMFTDDLLTALCKRDDGPWAEWWGDKVDAGKMIAPARRLGKLIDRFGIKPRTVRIGETTRKGYRLSDVAPAAHRYLSVTSVTSVTPLASTVTDVPGVTDTTQGSAR